MAITTSAAPTDGAADLDVAALETLIQSQLAATGTPGAAVALISAGRVCYMQGFGVAHSETNEPMTPDRLFRLGSTTKVFTAATLVSLAQAGRLDLSAPISAVDPGLHLALGRLSADQLLMHTAGLWDESPMYGSHDEGALGALINGWGAERLYAEPGAFFSYSNPAYWLAAHVIEQAGGERFADAVATQLLRPLGMQRSTFRPTEAMTYPLALGHDGAPGAAASVVRPIANNAAAWAAGSLFANVIDLSRFVIALLDGGRLDGAQALAPELVQHLFRAPVAVPTPAFPGARTAHYGYGLARYEYAGTVVYGHSGGRLGHGSYIAFAPRERCAVIILTNRTSVTLLNVVQAALAQLLGRAPDPLSTPEAVAPDLTLAGVYTHGPQTQLSIRPDAGGLVLEEDNAVRRLEPCGPDRYVYASIEGDEPGEIAVLRRQDGTLRGLFKDWRVYLK